jgi:hypothetical protein
MIAITQIPNNQTEVSAWKRHYRNFNEWCRRHRNRLLLCLGGLAAYEVVLGAFAWHYSHSPHALYPDPGQLFYLLALLLSPFCSSSCGRCFVFSSRKYTLNPEQRLSGYHWKLLSFDGDC